MSEDVTPIYALGNFVMDRSGNVTQYTFFYYYDKNTYYASLSKQILKEELNEIRRNMQRFLDEEQILINGERSLAKVINIDLYLLDFEHPVLEFIILFRGRLKKGVNVYENSYEEEVAEYPYQAIWRLPGKVIHVNMNGKISIFKNFLKIKVDKGTKVGGVEIIKFLLR